MLRLCLILGGLLAAARPAAASPDDILGLSGTSTAISPSSVLAPISIVEGPGIKVGEGTVLHPIFGLETGFISNTFYEDTDAKAAGITRLVVQLATASLSRERLRDTDGTPAANVGSMEYRAALQLSYDFYLSSDDSIQAQGGLGVAGLLRGTVFPKQTWSFLYLEHFERVLRATNFESTDHTNRDINRLHLGVRFAPPGRSLDGLLHYANYIDFFEDDNQRFANRMHNTFGLTSSWRFRPMTVFFGEFTQGIRGGLGAESTKVSSYPLTVAAGMQTLLTVNTTLIGRIGYTNGFYAAGPSYSSVLGGLQLGYRYSPVGRVAVTYEYGHFDSINANYYRDHAIVLDLEQQFAPLYINVRPELRFRNYQGVDAVIAGPDSRSDLIFATTASARYNFRNSLGAILEYRFSTVQTDYMSASGEDPSYVRHEIVAGVRAAL